MPPRPKFGLDSLQMSRISAHNTFEITASGNFTKENFKVTKHGIRSSPNASEVRMSGLDTTQLEVGEPIGRGASSTVFAAIHTVTGIPVALKRVSIHSQDRRHQLVSELKALVDCKAHSLVSLYDAFFDGEAVYMALEFMDSGTLADTIKVKGPMPDEVSASVALQLLQGLSYLESIQHMHRDFKPDNVLLSSFGFAKISDFGVSKTLTTAAPQAASFVGTAMYMSPERMKGELYSFPSDIWSFGLTIFECCKGCPAYPIDKYNDFLSLTLAVCEGPVPVPLNVSEQMTDFIGRCLQRDPTNRASAVQLLQHPLLQLVADNPIEPLRFWVSFLAGAG